MDIGEDGLGLGAMVVVVGSCRSNEDRCDRLLFRALMELFLSCDGICSGALDDDVK